MCSNYDNYLFILFYFIYLFILFYKICRVWIKDICIIHSIRHQLGEGGGKEEGEGGREGEEGVRKGGRKERRSKDNFSI